MKITLKGRTLAEARAIVRAVRRIPELHGELDRLAVEYRTIKRIAGRTGLQGYDPKGCYIDELNGVSL